MIKTVIKKAFGYASFAVQCGCVAHCTLEYVVDFVVCAGPSMEPTLHSQDILMTEHISPRFQRIQKGDIIVAKCPTSPNQHICKRVVGMPGDKMKTGFASYVIVPLGHVWLEGDNASNSSDSRNYGPVPQGLIISKALVKLWPFKDFVVFTSHRKKLASDN